VRWILLDLALIGLSVGLLAVRLLHLWRTVRTLLRAVASAGDLVGQRLDTQPLAGQASHVPAASRSPGRHR